MQRDAAYLSELTHLIYDAALYPERWNSVVEVIATSFNCTQALFATPYLAPQHGGLYFTYGIDEAYVLLYASRYIDQNVWNHAMDERGMWLDGQVYTEDEFVPREVFLATPFYQEFLRPQGTAKGCFGVVFAGSADLPASMLSMFRDLHEPEFTEEDKAWLKLLIPHVSRSMAIMLRLNTARVQNAALLASFDKLNFGVALLNEVMQVLHLNQAAAGVLARDDGLRLTTQRQLDGDGCTTDADNSLQTVAAWLAQVQHTLLADQPHFLQGVAVRRTDGCEKNDPGQVDVGRHLPISPPLVGARAAPPHKCYALQCVPLPKTDTWFAQQLDARYVVFITDPRAVTLPSDDRLHQLYGMTATQARVTCELAQGASYKEVAQHFQISLDTVRSHIKEIYRKTRVNRQSDLVHLILSISQSGV